MTQDDKDYDTRNFVTVNEAAKLLGLSRTVIYKHVKQNHLSSEMVGGRFMIPRTEIEAFPIQPTGRLRTKPVYWKRYRAGAKVRILRIHVTAHAEKLDTLWEKINHLLKKQEHVFPGTMQRYISASEKEPEKITLFFVWKDTELPDENRLFADLEQFKQAFADLLDWQTAEYTVERALLHT